MQDLEFRKRLFQYQDYRTFLRDYVNEKKRDTFSFSYGSWARRLGLKSPATLAMIVNGQRNPGRDLIATFSKYFKFSSTEREYFEDLILMRKCKHDPRQFALVSDRLNSKLPRRDVKLLEQKTFSCIANWYYFAIREMVHLADFKNDPEWIAQRLAFKVSVKEVVEAINTLLSLGLLAKDGAGRLRAITQNVDTSTDMADEALKRYHEQSFDNAKKAVRAFGVHDREVYGSTFAMNKAQLSKAKQLIRKFNVDLMALLEEDQTDQLFQLQIGLFPLTQTSENS